MKKLLLTSAIVAVAGVASAEVIWTGSTEFGWRQYMVNPDGSTCGADGDYDCFMETAGTPGEGLYVDAGLNATAATELDNGISASIDYGFDVNYSAEGGNDDGDSIFKMDNFPTLRFESSVGKMVVGEVDHAAHDLFEGNDAMDVNFKENGDELVARVDSMLSSFIVGGSYTVLDGKTDSGGAFTPYSDIGLAAGSMTAALKGEMMGGKVSAAYQTNEGNGVDTYGVSLGYGWNGISGVLAYTADSNDQSSVGFTAGYTMQNGLELEAGYANNGASSGYGLGVGFVAMGADIDLSYWSKDSGDEITADISYTIESAGVTIKAGYDNTEYNAIDDNMDGAYYAGAEYGLGNGASVFAAYSTGVEIGDPEYKAGASMGVKLSF